MIDCQFVYKFKSGAASDSLIQSCKVHAVPRVGEHVSFSTESGNYLSCTEVKEVIHYINPHNGSHEIKVMHGDSE
jgi:hypothetical protein